MKPPPPPSTTPRLFHFHVRIVPPVRYRHTLGRLFFARLEYPNHTPAQPSQPCTPGFGLRPISAPRLHTHFVMRLAFGAWSSKSDKCPAHLEVFCRGLGSMACLSPHSQGWAPAGGKVLSAIMTQSQRQDPKACSSCLSLQDAARLVTEKL